MPQPATELVTSRMFDVSRAKMFRAWTEPACIAQWWGPKGFRNTFKVFNPTAGGKWIFTMHGPNGVDYPNESSFEEVSPDRIIIAHESDHLFKLIATFEETNGKTRVTWRMVFESAEECAKVGKFAVACNEQNLDRLGDALKQLK